MEPLKISKIDMENIIYTKVKYNSSRNKKIIYLKYNDRDQIKNFVFQTPSLMNINSPKLNNGYYDIEIPLITKNSKKCEKFINFLNKLDNKILYDARINSNEWFDILEDENISYQRIIRQAIDNNNKNGMIKLKILKTNEFETILRLNDEKNIKINDYPVNSWVKMIVECSNIIITNSCISLFIRPIIMSFTIREISNYNYVFINDSDDEIVNENTNHLFISNNELNDNKNNDSNDKNNNENLCNILDKINSISD